MVATLVDVVGAKLNEVVLTEYASVVVVVEVPLVLFVLDVVVLLHETNNNDVTNNNVADTRIIRLFMHTLPFRNPPIILIFQATCIMY